MVIKKLILFSCALSLVCTVGTAAVAMPATVELTQNMSHQTTKVSIKRARPTVAQRVGRWCKNHKLAVAAAVVTTAYLGWRTYDWFANPSIEFKVAPTQEGNTCWVHAFANAKRVFLKGEAPDVTGTLGGVKEFLLSNAAQGVRQTPLTYRTSVDLVGSHGSIERCIANAGTAGGDIPVELASVSTLKQALVACPVLDDLQRRQDFCLIDLATDGLLPARSAGVDAAAKQFQAGTPVTMVLGIQPGQYHQFRHWFCAVATPKKHWFERSSFAVYDSTGDNFWNIGASHLRKVVATLSK